MGAELAERLVAAALGLPARLEADAQFAETSGPWTGSLSFQFGQRVVRLAVVDGVVVSAVETHAASVDRGDVAFGGSIEAWAAQLAGTPLSDDGLQRSGDRQVFWQYFAAVGRVIELLSVEVRREP